jgi:hypothetical protein
MIAMPKLIPAEHRNALSLAITRGDIAQVRYLVEEYDLDTDAFLDDSPTCMPVLMDALLSYGFATETERLPMLRYLLEKGANPNICCRKGYNCLHVAVQQDKYVKALDLLLDFHADVNVPDSDGANIVYWAVQGFLLRKAAEDDKAEYLRVFGKILRLGADLDQLTRYEMNARQWLEHAAPEVRELVARWEEGKPSVTRVSTIQPKFPTQLQYPVVARQLWSESGLGGEAATSVAGELLRAVETMRDEAQRGEAGRAPKSEGRQWSGGGRQHKRMVAHVRDTLVKSRFFNKAAMDRIRAATDQLMKVSVPYRADDVYDLLVDAICVYSVQKAGAAGAGQPVASADLRKAEVLEHS